MKHFICKSCGNLIAMVNDSGKRTSCCRTEMDELVPKFANDVKEKHKPNIKSESGKVTVSVGTPDNRHPQEPEHSISWVCLVTDKGTQRKLVPPNGSHEITFHVDKDEKIIKAFAYCNIHGLWVTECKKD